MRYGGCGACGLRGARWRNRGYRMAFNHGCKGFLIRNARIANPPSPVITPPERLLTVDAYARQKNC